MHIKTKSGRKVYLPTPEEEAQINAGIAADPDNPEWTDEMFARAVRFKDLPLPMQNRLRGQRGPQKAPRKIATTIRLSPEVLDYFQAAGQGWQTRLNDALKEWVSQRHA